VTADPHLYAAIALAVIALGSLGYLYWRFYHPKGD